MAELLRQDDFKQLPWKNGGMTMELFRIVHPSNPTKCLFRICIGAVTHDGAFSFLPGMDRTLMLMSGAGLKLHFPDKTVTLKDRLSSVSFAGEKLVECELIKDECWDFNVIIDRSWGKIEHQLLEVKPNGKLSIENDNFLTFVYQHQCSEPRLWKLTGEDILEVPTYSGSYFSLIKVHAKAS